MKKKTKGKDERKEGVAREGKRSNEGKTREGRKVR